MRGRPGRGRGQGEERDTRHPAPGGGGLGHGRAACKAGSARGGRAGKPRLPRDLVMSSPPPGAASTLTAHTGVPASSAPQLEPGRRRVPPNPPQEPAQRGRGSDPVSGSLAAFSRGAADGRAQRAPVAAGDTRPQNSLDTLTASGRPPLATVNSPPFLQMPVLSRANPLGVWFSIS